MQALVWVLVIAGLVVMAIGAFLIFKPPPDPPAQNAPQALADIADIIKQLKDLLLIFQKNVRTGLLVMIIGLILVCLGIFLEVHDTNDKVAGAPPVATAAWR